MATVTLAAAATAVTTNATSYVSGSFTPAAGDLLVVFVRAGATAATGTMSGSTGLTFTKVDHATFATSAHRVYCFVANAAAAASAQTVTFDCTGDAADGSVIVIYRVADMPTYGLSAVRQSAKTDNGSVAGTPAVTFASAVISGDATLGMVGNGANPATLTPPTNWTESSDVGYGTPASGAEAVFRDSGFTGTTITWGSTSGTTYGVLAVELNALPVATINTLVTPKPIRHEQLQPPQSRLVRVAGVPGLDGTADLTATATIVATGEATGVTLTAGSPVESTTSVTGGVVTLPSGLGAGDYTFLFCTMSGASAVITPPAGWSTAFASAQSTVSTALATAVYYRAWQSGDTNPTVTCTSGRLVVQPVKVSGADTSNPIE